MTHDYDDVHSDRRQAPERIFEHGPLGEWTTDHQASFFAALLTLSKLRLVEYDSMLKVATDVHHRLYGHSNSCFFAVSPQRAVLTYDREQAEEVAADNSGVLYIITATFDRERGVRGSVVTIDTTWRQFTDRPDPFMPDTV